MRCHVFTTGCSARQFDRRSTFAAQCLGCLAALSLLATSGCGYDNRAGAAAGGAQNQSSAPQVAPVRLLNVSYDPTRELWAALNSAFIPVYERETGVPLEISQSHAGSSNQARAIVEGLDADVATLAMWRDIELIRQNRLVKDDWEERLPHHSLPYYSTIVFVVRKRNPKNVHDWPDLVRDGVEIITPNPRTGGNGKLSFLAAWGSVLVAGGSEADAQRFVTELFKHVPVLDAGARAATITFARKQIGDVHLTWENEADSKSKKPRASWRSSIPRRVSAPSLPWWSSTPTSIAKGPARPPRRTSSFSIPMRRRRSSLGTTIARSMPTRSSGTRRNLATSNYLKSLGSCLVGRPPTRSSLPKGACLTPYTGDEWGRN